ncbi:phenol hydroxylase subunit [Propionivibrio sp.]|uniref:phenol hydroxylase subunit n=1 Tax=Propionivibrio sp. TaxID=2212460 RepID=UPI003BF3E13B
METVPISSNPPPPMDTSRRFVRVRGERGNGFIEFDFAIGEPELFVELILGPEAFADFCADNKVEMLPPLPEHSPEDGERSDWDWRLADATKTRFK